MDEKDRQNEITKQIEICHELMQELADAIVEHSEFAGYWVERQKHGISEKELEWRVQPMGEHTATEEDILNEGGIDVGND